MCVLEKAFRISAMDVETSTQNAILHYSGYKYGDELYLGMISQRFRTSANLGLVLGDMNNVWLVLS